jgi:predicted RNase H-like nuclease (RuvC/YqgF family)
MALETIIGYDPGGDGAHGVALLSIMDGKPEALQTRTFQTTEQVIEYIEAVGSIDALGVDR